MTNKLNNKCDDCNLHCNLCDNISECKNCNKQTCNMNHLHKLFLCSN